MIQYSAIIILLAISIIIACIMVGLSYIVGNKSPDAEKISTYECGFTPFNDSRKQFEVRFFLVGILFIIFDLEISFLFPWSIIVQNIEIYGYWSMYVFLFALTIGLVYEWNTGGLEWE